MDDKLVAEMRSHPMYGHIAYSRETMDNLLAALKAETARADRYAERLEITFHWVSYDDGTTLTRVEVPREDWDKQHDGIDCRDETIKLQDAAVDKLRAQLTTAQDRIAALEAGRHADRVAGVRKGIFIAHSMFSQYLPSQRPRTDEFHAHLNNILAIDAEAAAREIEP